jgi:hypothetical protein
MKKCTTLEDERSPFWFFEKGKRKANKRKANKKRKGTDLFSKASQ